MAQDAVSEVEFAQKVGLEELPAKLWIKIVEAINSVLDGHKYYGFAHFDAYADPSIDVIVERSRILGQILELVIGSPHLDDCEISNLLVNCQQSIHLIQRTHASLKNGDEQEYESCISKLSSQRQY
jgi:hypothetical protein